MAGKPYELLIRGRKDLNTIEKKLSEGNTEEYVASLFGVSISTFNYWKKENKELLRSVIIGKNKLKNRLEVTALNKAMGYSAVVETEEGTNKDGDYTKTKTRFIQSDKILLHLMDRTDKELERNLKLELLVLEAEERKEKIKTLQKINRLSINSTFEGKVVDVEELKKSALRILDEGGFTDER